MCIYIGVDDLEVSLECVLCVGVVLCFGLVDVGDWCVVEICDSEGNWIVL